MSRTLPNKEFANILMLTNEKITPLYNLPKDRKFFFLIEGLKVLDYWKPLYEKLHAISIVIKKETVLDDADFNKLLFFVKQIGDYYRFGGYDTNDALYASQAQFFVQRHYADKEITPEDQVLIFFNAFPEKKK